MEEEERPRKIRKLSPAQDELGGPCNDFSGEQSGIPLSEVRYPYSENSQSDNDDDNSPHSQPNGQPNHGGPPAGPTPLSKNQLKKLRRQQDWDEGRADRKAKKKEKAKEAKERKRAVKQQEAAEGRHESIKPKPRQHSVEMPLTLIFDCDFDELMLDKEIVSLASQLTRCYSDNKNALFRAHLVISSFSGRLRQRFDTVLAKHYESWLGVRISEEDFVTAAEKAGEWMRGGPLVGVFVDSREQQQDARIENETNGHDEARPRPEEEIVEDVPGDSGGEVIYLTSDSPNTLTSLRPYSTYIIGGLVDRNRHKGICYKRACERGIRTAKLPISEFMEMSGRAILATNHVCEIMLRWLECGDWGEAFVKVMPKRKGAALKSRPGQGTLSDDDHDADEQHVENGHEEQHALVPAQVVEEAETNHDGPNAIESAASGIATLTKGSNDMPAAPQSPCGGACSPAAGPVRAVDGNT